MKIQILNFYQGYKLLINIPIGIFFIYLPYDSE